VSKAAGVRSVGVWITLILAMAAGAIGQAQPTARSHAQGRLATAANATAKAGIQAKLPPHISTLLGLTKEEECPVLQSVVRTGSMVQGFDVSVANKNEIVLFVVDEQANDQSLYLTSPEGKLRKVVSVKAGVGDVVRISGKEIAAFNKEKQFWEARLAPSAPYKQNVRGAGL
jgi:hypothetical protein